jgi:PhnB protein
MTKPILEGYHTVKPIFTFRDSKKAVEFYKKAFGAKVLEVLPSPKGERTMHATIKIGDSILMMGDEMPD